MSEGVRGPCQVRIVATSFYFYLLSHCIRQTKNTGEGFFKKKEKKTVPCFTTRSLEFRVVRKRRGPAEQGIWEASPAEESPRSWEKVTDRSAWGRLALEMFSRDFLVWADEQLEIYWP